MIKKYFKQYKHLIKEGGWVFFGQTSVAIISLVGLRILTEIAPANILGGATLWLGILSLLKNIFIAPIGNTQIRFHPEYLHQGFGKWFNDKIKHLYSKFLLISVLFFCIIFFTWSYFSSLTLNFLLLLILVAYFILDAVKGFKINRLSAERRQKNIALWQITNTLLINVFFIVALLVVNNIESYITGQTIGLFIGLIIFGFINFPKIKSTVNKTPDYPEIRRKLVNYGLPFVPLAVVSWISNLGDRYIIGNYLTLNDVGIYTAAYSIASRPLIMIAGTMSGFFRPILFQDESENNTEKAKRTFKIWFITSLIIFAFTIMLFAFAGDLIINVLLSKSYTKNIYPIFLIIGIAYAIFSLIQIIENRILSYGNSKKIIFPNVIAAVVNILINLLLIPVYGIKGAAFATLISFSIQMIVSILVLNILNNQDNPY